MQLLNYKAEKREAVKMLEKLWDKYRVSLEELVKERDEEIDKLHQFLEKLGYLELKEDVRL